MSPGAGLNFGILPKGQASAPQTVTLFNDPSDPKSATINFTGNLVQGNFTETDNCVGTSLAPGSSCTITVIFKSKTAGFNSGTDHDWLHSGTDPDHLFAWHGAVIACGADQEVGRGNS